MKKLSIEQQELLQQMVQGNDLREITPFKALEMIKKQVGNIHVFTDEMPPQQTTIELRNSGLFEIIEQAFDEYLILQKMRAEYKFIEEELGIDISKVIIFCLKGGFAKSPYENKIIEFKPMVRTTISFEFKHIQLGFPKPNSIADCDFDVVLFKDYGKTWALTKEELE